VIPVVQVAEMRAIDAASEVPTEELIRRAGAQVGRQALRLLGGTYGRRVVVVAGKGHNGDDGRVAAAWLAARGAKVAVLDAARAPEHLPACDLVVDAAYGTGFSGEYRAPLPAPGTSPPVVAVDIPSGLAGDTGQAGEGAVRANLTVTFAALKPGLLLGQGPERAGRVSVADIGLDASGARAHLVEDVDVAQGLPPRPREAHKWSSAVYVAAGSPGMHGSARLCAAGAMRAGAGMVRLGVPGAAPSELPPTEAVGSPLPLEGWDVPVLEALARCRALVVGPGLGRSEAARSALERLVAAAPVPTVVDADGLALLGRAADVRRLSSLRRAPLVLTPHDGEFARLAGGPPGEDRLGAARRLAAEAGAVVLLKGPTTLVAEPGGRALFVTSGSARLATAGTGDVLAGMVGAFLAQGLDAEWAAGLAAHVHGAAARLGFRRGLVASDLPGLVARWTSRLGAPGRRRRRGPGRR
jgi:hydroxyethylthiazole kinase-like uncharacterized protein yjeF